MARKRHLVILLSFATSLATTPSSNAQIPNACRAAYGETGTINDTAEAAAILGVRVSNEKFRAALNYVQSRKYSSQAGLVSDLNLLFTVIQQNGVAWYFRMVEAPDNSVLIVGKAGPVIVVSPDARLYRGMAPESLFDGGTWRPDYSRLRLLETNPEE